MSLADKGLLKLDDLNARQLDVISVHLEWLQWIQTQRSKKE